MSFFETEQESFWAGTFGQEYILRNQSDARLSSNIAFFSRALQRTRDIKTCMEFGANIGMNLRALKQLYSQMELSGIEINADAARQLGEFVPPAHVHNLSILEFKPAQTWDLVLVKGVLIHINPEVLNEVYDKLVSSCGRYLLVAEYYNPTPLSVEYRGFKDRLFKRDFAGEIMDQYPQMKLIDYGFVYRRDPNFPQDDMTWFLLEKSIR